MGIMSKLFSSRPYTMSSGKVVYPPIPIAPFIILSVAFFCYIAGIITGVDLGMLIKRGHYFFDILGQMVPPKLSFSSKVVEPLIDTVSMSFLGSFIGSISAIPFAVLASTNINHSRIFLTLIRLILSIVRTLPVLIIALIATYIFGIGTFAGTVAIAIFTFGIVSKMLYEQIETVDMAAFIAMEAMGLTKLQAFRQAILPQIIPSYFSIALYSLEINVRYAAILGYVGAGGIGLILNGQIAWRSYDKVSTILIMLFITVVIIETLSRGLRERFM